MASRIGKQLFIVVIYTVIIGGIISGSLWLKYKPTCSDGIKNNGEEGIDCGTLACGVACPVPVQTLQVKSTQVAKTPAGDFDVAIQVYNPNGQFGVGAGSYDLVFKDAIGTEVLRKSNNNFYLLPGQTKYMVLTSLKDIPAGSTPSVEFKSIQWQQVTGDASVSLILETQTLTSTATQATVEAIINNNTDYDFDNVDVDIVVSDSSGTLITTNQTNFQTFLSHTRRSIKATWPFPLPANARVYIEIGTNVFDNSNFLKTHGTQEKFQQYF